MRWVPALLEQASPVRRRVGRPSQPAGHRSLRGRLTNIIGEPLCDDVLQLLQPSLPKPHTCDIIDINPGQSIWSQKLHDLLQPRRHILVEPRTAEYGRYIDPLLHRPDSAYRYASSIAEALDPKNKLLSEDTYKFREGEQTGSLVHAPQNDGLLVTGNLSAPGKVVKGFKGSGAKMLLNDYFRDVFVKDDYIHRYGLVRMLFWVGNDVRLAVMPPSVNARTKQSIQLESAYEIEEVAGPAHERDLYRHQRRWYDLEIENQQHVEETQTALGLKTPPARRMPESRLPLAALDPTVEVLRNVRQLYPDHQVFIDKILDLDEYLSTHHKSWYKKYLVEVRESFDLFIKRKHKDGDGRRRSLYRRLMTQLRSRHNTHLKSTDFIKHRRQLMRDIEQAWHDGWFSPVSGLAVSGPNEESARSLLQADERMEAQCRRIKFDTRALVYKALDDYHCYDAAHQILSWNHRRYEPLLVIDQEFNPKKPLTLFDFKPKPSLPPQLDTVGKQICFDYVCTTLMTGPNKNIVDGLGKLVRAGIDQFLERVPELRDPSKGGWPVLKHARIRTLHPDLFVAVALAFHDWPHRPALEKLMATQQTVFDKRLH